MNKNLKKILTTTISAILIGSCAYAYDNGDFQIWNTYYQDVKVIKDVLFSMEQEFRFGKNAGELYYQHYDFGAVFSFDKMLDLGFFYRQVFERLHLQKWREEDQPNIDATIKLDIWKFKLDDRNRFEYRHFRYKDDSFRYRNRLTVKFPLDIAKLKIKISPYSSDEMFMTSDSTGFDENRFSSGLEIELTKYIKTDLYYMFKSNKIKDNKWSNSNVLGTKIKIVF